LIQRSENSFVLLNSTSETRCSNLELTLNDALFSKDHYQLRLIKFVIIDRGDEKPQRSFVSSSLIDLIEVSRLSDGVGRCSRSKMQLLAEVMKSRFMDSQRGFAIIEHQQKLW
jgi:hypothetical protein